MKKGHFWFSQNQWRSIYKTGIRNRNYAMINGKEVEYTEKRAGAIKKPRGSWDDYEYLGFGYYYRSGKV